jgi:hypothetical protein
VNNDEVIDLIDNIDPDEVCHVKCKQRKILQEKLKIAMGVLEEYGYPSHEDGDRAYIFGHKARKVIDKIKEIK